MRPPATIHFKYYILTQKDIIKIIISELFFYDYLFYKHANVHLWNNIENRKWPCRKDNDATAAGCRMAVNVLKQF